MKGFLIKIALFSLISLCIYVPISLYVLPIAIGKIGGPSTRDQIVKSFNDVQKKAYDLIILGNSVPYRGINPDFIDIPAYNFSHDNDSYNQLYYKLLFLDRKNIRPKYLFVGVNYPQFSFKSGSRNYVYNSFFEEAYQQDFPEMNSFSLFIDRTRLDDPDRFKFLLGLPKSKTTSIFHRDNGQYIKPGIARINDAVIYSIDRLPLQEKYFKLILEYCKENGIEVFLCMLPNRKNVLKNFKQEEMDEFNQYISSHTNEQVHYLNYSDQEGWTLADYTDITHFTEQAANRFSKMLNDDMMKIIASKKQEEMSPSPSLPTEP